jgi:hypothetical protein
MVLRTGFMKKNLLCKSIWLGKDSKKTSLYSFWRKSGSWILYVYVSQDLYLQLKHLNIQKQEKKN